MRDLNPAVIEAIDRGVVTLGYFFEGFFSLGTLRLWTGNGNKVLNGNTYSGNGALVGVSNLREVLGAQANGLTITISGIDMEMVSLLLNETASNKTGTLYMAWLDIDYNILGSDILFSGDLDRIKIKETPGYSIIDVDYESKLIRLKNKRERLWTHNFQQSLYPGDTGFQYLDSIKNKRIYWGEPDTSRGS